MFTVIGNEFADQELQLLSELLNVLDVKIIDIRKSIYDSLDPESEGLLDKAEYFIGVGFSTIQQYLTDTLTLTGLNKREALDIGPKFSEEFHFIAVLNAAANWWKHSPEWLASEKKEDKQTLRTQNTVVTVAETEDYPLSNVLAKLTSSNEGTLSSLLPNILLWRSSVNAHATEH